MSCNPGTCLCIRSLSGGKIENKDKNQFEQDLIEFFEKHGLHTEGSILFTQEDVMVIDDSLFSMDGSQLYYGNMSIGLTEGEFSYIRPILEDTNATMKLADDAEYEHASETRISKIRGKIGLVTGRDAKRILKRKKGKITFNPKG